MLEISIAAEPVFRIGNFPVTNSLLMTWVVMGVLTILSLYTYKTLKRKPTGFQTVMEMIIGGLHSFFAGLLGPQINLLFPLVASIFLFIIFSNWMGLFPGVGTIGLYEKVTNETNAVEPLSETVAEEKAAEQAVSSASGVTHSTASASSQTEKNEVEKNETKFVPILRAPTADLNMTLALALIAFFAIQYYGFKMAGPAYGKKFINLSNPIFFFVGILEIISDISKIISFTFRLFGNIFAGEVLLAVMAFLFPFFIPIPFYALELFVGFIQALVFAMLVAVFINIAVSHGKESHSG